LDTMGHGLWSHKGIMKCVREMW